MSGRRFPFAIEPGRFSSIADPPPYRVGDFSGTVVDPVDGTFWAGNEYATDAVPPPGFTRPFGNWGTWIAHFEIAGDGVLAAASLGAAPEDVLAAPSALLAGDSSDLRIVSSSEADDLTVVSREDSASIIAQEAVATLQDVQVPVALDEDDILDAVDRALDELTVEPLEDPLTAESAPAHV